MWSQRLFLAAIVTLIGSTAVAEPPALIPVQGFLTDSDGAVIDGDVDLTFAIYDQESSGSLLWSDQWTAFAVEDGFFTVYLGDDTALDLGIFETSELWLEMSVDAEALSRVQLASVPFALEAAVAQQVGTFAPADIQPALGEACATGEFLGGWNDATDQPICRAPVVTAAALADQNTATTPIHWLDITNVPGELSDGDDVLSPEEVATAATAQGFALESALNDGVTTSAPVGWADLVGIPTEISDGDDVLSPEEVATAAGAQGYVHQNELFDVDPDTAVIDWRDLTIQNVITLSPGDNINQAIDNISDASATNPYLVWLAPGEYVIAPTEKIYVLPYVHLRGSGREVTRIIAGNSVAVDLSANSSMSDLRVERRGSTDSGAVVDVIDAPATIIRDVDIVQVDGHIFCSGLVARGATTSLLIDDVNVSLMGQAGCDRERIGMYIAQGAHVRAINSSFSVDTSPIVRGITLLSNCTLDLVGVEVVSTDTTDAVGQQSYGINVFEETDETTTLTMRGGTITAIGTAAHALAEYGTWDISGVHITASGSNVTNGLIMRGGTTTVRQSVIDGRVYTFPDSELTFSSVDVIGEKPAVFGSGTMTCYLVSVDNGEAPYVVLDNTTSCTDSTP